jgi:hypothetical protein
MIGSIEWLFQDNGKPLIPYSPFPLPDQYSQVSGFISLDERILLFEIVLQ